MINFESNKCIFIFGLTHFGGSVLMLVISNPSVQQFEMQFDVGGSVLMLVERQREREREERDRERDREREDSRERQGEDGGVVTVIDHR